MSPALPLELQQLIFERAIEERMDVAPQLALVARYVQHFVEPLIYRTVILDSERRFRLFRRTVVSTHEASSAFCTIGTFLGLVSKKPQSTVQGQKNPKFFDENVISLLIHAHWVDFRDLDALENGVLDVMNLCTGIMRLELSVPFTVGSCRCHYFEVSALLHTGIFPAIEELSCRVEFLSAWTVLSGTQQKFIVEPCFFGIKRLRIWYYDDAPWDWAQIDFREMLNLESLRVTTRSAYGFQVLPSVQRALDHYLERIPPSLQLLELDHFATTLSDRESIEKQDFGEIQVRIS